MQEGVLTGKLLAAYFFGPPCDGLLSVRSLILLILLQCLVSPVKHSIPVSVINDQV